MTQLNPQQLQAVRHGGGPLLILAGAGTGKTRVVTERMAHLLRQGVRPANLLGVTFTNKAASEMRTRVGQLLKGKVPLKELIISTFHSLAVRIIRRDARLIGYGPGFSICDRGEQIAVVRKASSTVRGAADLSVEDVLSRIGSLKNKGVMPEEFGRLAVDDDELALHAIYRRYQEALRRQNCLDFDDLLLQALNLFRTHPEALEFWRSRFHHIMVDEFQDANAVQFSLVRLLAAPRDNLCVVGDDDQSIYAWRGAAAGNILKFHDSYPSAFTVTLEQNYRSTPTILSAANAVIRNNSGRREKNLWSGFAAGRRIRVVPFNDQFEEAEGIVRAIRERRQAGGAPLKYGDFAVIIRANAQSKALEDEFLAAKMPYEVIGGQSVFDRKESRDVIAFLSLVANPDADNQLLRVINVPPRGIGGKTVDLLTAHAARCDCRISALLADPERAPGLSGKQADACRAFSRQIDSWRARLADAGFGGLVRAMLEETRYEEELAQLYRDPLEAASRWNEALEVGESLAAFAERNAGAPAEEILADFLCEAMLAGRQESGKKGEYDAVRIITAHSAKGLEYPFVFVPGLEEEIFPHKNAIEAETVEEERRLFYVAMTRARLELTLTYNRMRVLRGKERKRQPSRFLDEIPAEYVETESTPTRLEEAMDWLSAIKEKLKA